MFVALRNRVRSTVLNPRFLMIVVKLALAVTGAVALGASAMLPAAGSDVAGVSSALGMLGTFASWGLLLLLLAVEHFGVFAGNLRVACLTGTFIVSVIMSNWLVCAASAILLCLQIRSEGATEAETEGVRSATPVVWAAVVVAFATIGIAALVCRMLGAY